VVKRIWTALAIVGLGILIAMAMLNGWYNG
jgi:hypothetical protein